MSLSRLTGGIVALGLSGVLMNAGLGAAEPSTGSADPAARAFAPSFRGPGLARPNGWGDMPAGALIRQHIGVGDTLSYREDPESEFLSAADGKARAAPTAAALPAVRPVPLPMDEAYIDPAFETLVDAVSSYGRKAR